MKKLTMKTLTHFILLASVLLSSTLSHADQAIINYNTLKSFHTDYGAWNGEDNIKTANIDWFRAAYITVEIANEQGEVSSQRVSKRVYVESKWVDEQYRQLNRIKQDSISFEVTSQGVLCFKTIGMIDQSANSLIFDRVLVNCKNYLR